MGRRVSKFIVYFADNTFTPDNFCLFLSLLSLSLSLFNSPTMPFYELVCIARSKLVEVNHSAFRHTIVIATSLYHMCVCT